MTVQDAVEAKIDAAKDGVKIQTYERYKRMFRNHIQDTRFGNMKLEDVRASECEAFIQTLYQKNLGYGSVKHLKRIHASQLYESGKNQSGALHRRKTA